LDVIFEICKRTDRQTDAPIAVVYLHPSRGWSNKKVTGGSDHSIVFC